jgi:hypothetical protein
MVRQVDEEGIEGQRGRGDQCQTDQHLPRIGPKGIPDGPLGDGVGTLDGVKARRLVEP